MSRLKKYPLRPLTADEQGALAQLSRSQAAPAVQVTRAKLLLLVAAGSGYQDAAHAVGRHGGGRRPVYDGPARARILREAQRRPTPEGDGTASWSLSGLKKVLRQAPDGLPFVSTYTLWNVLHEAGYAYQRTRTWCPTGTALRQRKAGVAAVTDPDAAPKKS
jgi:transposase